MIKAVFYDIDGIIVDSEPLHVEKITAVARDPLNKGFFDPACGVLVRQEDWRELHGIGDHRIHAWLKNKNPAFPLSLDEFLGACEDYYVGHAGTLKVRDGLAAAFNIFDAAGIPQAAVSSGVKRQVDVNLKTAGLDTRLVFALSAEDVVKTKPAPEPYLKGYDKMLTMKFNGNAGLLRPADCLVIEDSGSGVASGHAAGMRVALWKLANGPDNPLAVHNLAPDAGSLTALAAELTCSRSRSPSPVIP